MQWQQIGRQVARYIRRTKQRWLDLRSEELNNTQRQLEHIIDSVCNRYSVARITVEHEIYDGLERMGTRSSPIARNRYREGMNL
jgi:hypothetical protein